MQQKAKTPSKSEQCGSTETMEKTAYSLTGATVTKITEDISFLRQFIYHLLIYSPL